MRWITSQIQALWKQSEIRPGSPGGALTMDQQLLGDGESGHSWRPWEHIYAISKVTRGPNIPVYNPHGKYVVKLYWMGCWRKIIVDDLLPFDEQDRLLLPATTIQQEIWPMLLTKALLKVASLDLNGGSSSCEFGDFSVVGCLTGWLPEAIPLQYGHTTEIWELLQAAVTKFKLPETPADGSEGMDAKDPNTANGKDEKSDKERSSLDKSDVKSSRDGKEKGKEKEKEKGKDDKKDKKDKDKGKEKSMLQEEAPLPEHPEVVVFASYSGPPKYPVRISVLGEMADASERLRQNGLSHMYPHPVLVTQSRDCPLEPPAPPEVVPSWKLIRPRKKRTTPSDEPQEEPEEEKPIQCLQITSPFLNYRVSAVPIPTNTHRPKSALERGGTRVSSRPGTANVAAIEETDENAPEQDPQQAPPAPKVEEQEPPKTDEPPKDDQLKPSTPNKERKKSATKSSSRLKADTSQERILSPKSSKTSVTGTPKSGVKRVGSAVKSDRDAKAGAVTDPKGAKDTKVDATAKGSGSIAGLVETPTDAPPVPTEGGECTENAPEVSDAPLESETNPQDPNAQDVWMDFDNFCKCFKTLYIFHKTNTYPCNYKHSDLKAVSSSGKEKTASKSAPNTAAGSTEDKSPSYLFVDSLKPTEIVVSFSALSRWNDPPPPPPKEESKTTLKGGKDRDRDSKAEAMTLESSSMIDGIAEPRPPEPLQPGLLVAEPYSWKSLVSGQPILRLRTTATRAAVLSLPEGRHLLKFSMTSLLGYHIHLSSSTQFVFGDEEKVMEQLTKESCRFIDNSVQVMSALGKCITTFSDAVTLNQAWDEYYASHCPYRDDKHASKTHHHRVYNEALYQMLRKVLTEASLASPEMAFAWRAFNFDCTTKNILNLPYGSSSRPATGVTTSDRGSAGGKKGTKKQPTETKVEPWKSKYTEPTPEDHVAAIKIQRGWRALYVRKIKTARTPGMEENVRVQETLLKAWTVIEANIEQNGLALFRAMFKADPDLMTRYPFYKDEWNKISFMDYQGGHPDQPPNTWFVVFREVFYVTEEMLCVPKLYVPIPTCMLRVINNDTGEEVPRVFQKVAPYVYKKNKRGYTFTAEARTLDQPLQAGRWRIRLIGSLSQLPAPNRNEVNSSFHTRELRDYYVPNDKNIILRYSVKVQDEHLVSLQMMTSKPDVYIKLQVLDQEVEVLGAIGKGHVVLPAFLFQKDPLGEEDSKRSSSRSSLKAKGSRDNLTSRNKRAGSARSTRSSHSRHSITSIEEEDEKSHKYIIQAQVLRDSWPLSESQWTFVGMLKEMEKNEIKLSHKERPPSPPRGEKQSATSTKASKDKGGKGKGKDKEKGSRPPSQQFDFSKPNWTLRVVSDGAYMDDLDVRKDTERADEIRAMKKAWEDAEPGRAAKAMQSRLQYLNSHMIKAKPEEDELESKSSETDQIRLPDGAASPVPTLALDAMDNDTVLTLEPPPPPAPKEILPLIDLTPFLRNTGNSPRLRDEEEIQRQMEVKQQEIATYRAHREEVERSRKQEKIQRNMLKVKQLEMFEQMQASLDAARDAINNPREAFRQKFLEAERQRLEEIAAQEAALRAEQDKVASPKGRKSAKGGKKTPQGKKKK